MKWSFILEIICYVLGTLFEFVFKLLITLNYTTVLIFIVAVLFHENCCLSFKTCYIILYLL